MKKQSIIGIVMLFLLISAKTFAYDTEIDGLRYDWVSTNGGTGGNGLAKLVGYSGVKLKEDLTIPCSVVWNTWKSGSQGHRCNVREVQYYAFQNCSILKSVNFSCVRNIGISSFENCTSLKTLHFSNTISYISSSAFKGCSALMEIHIENNTPPTIYEDSFDEETYQNATLYVPEGMIDVYRAHDIWNKFQKISDGTTNRSYTLEITSVGNGSASYDGTMIREKTSSFTVAEGTSAMITFTPDNGFQIQSVKVNGTTVSISGNQYTINNISKNTTIEVAFTNTTTNKFEVDGLYYNIIANNQVEVTYESYNEHTYSGELKIPETVTYNGVKYAVTAIGYAAFSGCTDIIGSLIIPQSITTIASTAFYRCKGLSGSLIIPNSVTFIGNGAFQECSGFTGILSIPSSVKVIEGYAFRGCSGFTGELTIPNSVTTIGNFAFEGCSGFTGSLKIPKSINTIEDGTFRDCSGFTDLLTIPNSVTSIGNYAFKGCNGFAGSLIIPNSVTSIGKYAFRECTGLTELTIPNSVTYIGDYAFYGCSSIGQVKTEIENPFSIDNYVFYGISSSAKLLVPKETKTKYQALAGWTKYFKEIVEMGTTPTTYSLSITASGNGSASYGGTTIRSKTSSFTLNAGSSATITFTPDNGYRIKSVKVNNSTVSVSNNQYTISSINANTTVSVEFEAIPPTTYTLSITASGNGSASYGGNTIRSKTSSFTVNQGSSATISFTPDNAYRIKTVKVNNSTVSVSNNQYTISSINANTTVSVEFEAIPVTTYTLSITASGNGSASYGGTTIRSKTTSFTVNEGTSATIIFTPDNGYRIKSVKVNNTAVSVSNNQYTISSINANTTVSVEFEAIPVTTYTLSITASGNGSASYSGTTIRSKTSSFTVNAGSSATITFTPDNGYRIKSVKVNSSTVSVSNNQYTISSINANTTVSVEFEAIPVTTYTLSITASGNGSVSYGGTTIRSKTSSFTVNAGSSATITFSPDNGYRIKSVKVNNIAVSVSNNQYTISSINANTTVSVEFEAITYTLSITASGNGSASYSGTTIRSKTSSFTVNAGSSATITFTPDNGYRIKSVKVNSSTVSVSNNQYTISSINANTTVSVEFEAIPVTTYTLSITASGNGSVSYGGTTIRSKTSSFTVNQGTSATITFTPDNGYRIKSVKVNNSTVSVSNSQYTISSINANTTVSVEFEAIPVTTYTLSITASGNGSASYGGTTIRSKTNSFTVNAGSSAMITFTPDNGYRIKSVKVNNTAVSVSNNQYTISSINGNTTVSVEFEVITYTLSITASGNGSASYGGTTIRSKTSSFTVNSGSSATITFTPDNGYRIKSVKVNNSTVSVSNNQYSISSINANTTVSVEFEAIPPTTYTLSISASGNGSASYGGTTIRSKTSSFTVNEGASATITFTPDNGYRIKGVKVNNTTVSVTNNQYTISSINSNTMVSVEFESIPPTTYTLSITASGNGSASYGGTTIRSKTSSFTVNEGSSATITFTPDNGNKIKSVKVNGTTVSLSNNQYTISSINSNTTVSVEFEAITYTLSITASGNGSASYGGTTIRSKTSSFTVNQGSSATITFTPDNGYRIKSVKVNNTAVSVSNNQYTISSINANTTVSVEFEAIPVTTYTLSITASGNGSASYGGTTIRSKTSSFTVNEGSSATITFTPDNGNKIKSVKVNGTTVSLSNNQYTISSINSNTTVSVEFEAITYTLSITASGNGYASYGGTTIRNKSNSFTVSEGSSAIISFSPDNGYRIKSVKLNSSDVTSYVSNNSYTISNINRNTSFEVEFAEELKTFTSGGINYSVSSYDDKTIIVGGGNYGKVLEVPAEITYQDIIWKVIGIDNAALADNTELAAIIWNPAAMFTISVSNPNLLLYVTSASFAPSSITNVIVNGTANKIVLVDAASGNDFYCPNEFTAKSISYTHNYLMTTGIGESRGWETIALPFDVQKITHSSKGELTPFANWKSGDGKKPFWLMGYETEGWTDAGSILANTPYIISMPNHQDYKSEYRINGSITFYAENATVKRTDDLKSGSYNGNTFVPSYFNADNSGYYALNVNNDYVSYYGESVEGSRFVANLRPVRPFEAYMISSSSAARSIAISDDMTTDIKDINVLIDENLGVRVYNMKGQLVIAEMNQSLENVKKRLPAGVYIVNGKKLIIK